MIMAASVDAEPAPAAGLGIFEKWLSVWVGLTILAGLALGNLIPDVFGALASIEYASVNLIVAVLIWAMIYPMMIAVDFASLRSIGERPKGIFLTLTVNWLIKPFSMAALAVLFFEVVFAPLIPPADAEQYIAGLILLGAAPCTAMVFVWSQMTKGDPAYTLVQVSLNDVIMIFAFAPIVALLLGVTSISVPWETLLLSVLLYVVVPLIAGALTRRALIGKTRDTARIDAFTAKLKPLSILRPAADRRPVVWISGRTHYRPAPAHRHDSRSDHHPELRHLFPDLWCRLCLEGAVQRSRAVRADRHVQLFRAGRCGRHRAVRYRQRCRARYGRRCAGRGARDAVAGCHRKPDTDAVHLIEIDLAQTIGLRRAKLGFSIVLPSAYRVPDFGNGCP